MRAWIEIQTDDIAKQERFVALFMRAWIEIASTKKLKEQVAVALFMRAWIEISIPAYALRSALRRPLHEGVD